MRSQRSRKPILAIVLTVFLLSGLVGSAAAIKHMQAWPSGPDDSDLLIGGGGRRSGEPLRAGDRDTDAQEHLWLLLRIVHQTMKLVWLP